MICLTDLMGKSCWVRVDEIKAISVGPRYSAGSKRQRTRIRLSLQEDGLYIDVLETPDEVAKRIEDLQKLK